MLSFLSPYKLLIEVALIGSLFAGAAYGFHRFLTHEQQIGYDKAVAEYSAKYLAEEQAAHAKDLANAKQLQDAQNAAALREKTIVAVAAAAANSSASLRDAIANISRGVPTATLDALRHSTRTLGSVLDECQNKYRSVAEAADRANTDKQTLMDAWPK